MDYFLFNFSGVQFHYTMSLVHFYEDGTPKENIAKAVERVFKTESGTKLVKTMFGL